MAITIGTIEAVARLRDNLTPKLKGLNDRISAAGKHTVGVGKRMGQTWQTHGRQVGLAAGVVSAGMLAIGNSWDNARKTIAQGTGATGDDLDALMGTYRSLAGTVKGDVSSAVADLNTQFGATGPVLEKIVTHTLKAKQAFGDFDITSLGQAMKSFGVDAEGTGEFLDHAGTVAQATGHSMQALVNDMRMYGPIAKNAGLSSEETATFIGKMAEAGVSVSRVMPGLNAAMRNAAKEGVTDLRGHLNDAIISVREATTDTDALRVATETFGAEGAQRMVSAIRSGVLPSIDELSTAYTNTAGKTIEVYGETLTLMDQFGLLKDRMSALVGPAGNVIGIVGSLGAVLAGLGPFLPQIAAGARLMWAALTGPVGLTVTAIGLVGLALYKFREQVGNVMASTIQIVGKWADSFLEGIQFAFSWIPGLGSKLDKARAAVANFTNDMAYLVDGWGEASDKGTKLTEDVGKLTGEFGKVTAQAGRLAQTLNDLSISDYQLHKQLKDDSLPTMVTLGGKFDEIATGLGGKLIPQTNAAANALTNMAAAGQSQLGLWASVKNTISATSDTTKRFTENLKDAAARAAGTLISGGQSIGSTFKKFASSAFDAAAGAAAAFAGLPPQLGIVLVQPMKKVFSKVGGFIKGLFGGGDDGGGDAQKAMEDWSARAVSAWERAADAGKAAYDHVTNAYLTAGFTQAEAAAMGLQAQEYAIYQLMIAEGNKYARLAAFEAALAARRSGNAENAMRDAVNAANETLQAWYDTWKVIDQASTDTARITGWAAETTAQSWDRASDQAEQSWTQASNRMVNATNANANRMTSAVNKAASRMQSRLSRLWGHYSSLPAFTGRYANSSTIARLKAFERNEARIKGKPDPHPRPAHKGTGGIRDWGTSGTPVNMHGREGVFTQQQIEKMIAAAASGGGGGGGQEVVLNLDGEVVGRVVMGRIRGIAQGRGY